MSSSSSPLLDAHLDDLFADLLSQHMRTPHGYHGPDHLCGNPCVFCDCNMSRLFKDPAHKCATCGWLRTLPDVFHWEQFLPDHRCRCTSVTTSAPQEVPAA